MKITKLEIVTAFELDPAIILSCGPALKSLQSSYGGRIVSINTPDDAAPSVPRVVLKLSDTVLNVTHERFQLIVIPPSHISGNLDESVNFATERAKSFFNVLKDAMPSYRWSGFIVDIEHPFSNEQTPPPSTLLESSTRAHSENGEVISCGLNLGFREDGFYLNYRASSYEQRTFQAPPPPPGKPLYIQADTLPIEEVGINIVLDINNRNGGATNDLIEDIAIISSRISGMNASLPRLLNLEGIIQ